MTDMSDMPGSPRPMEGHGGYNRSSRVQAAGLLPAVALLEQAAAAVALPPAPDPVVLADYGSSEGHNSLLPMAAAIGALRARIGPDRAISVVHTDVPGNDFTALFQTLAADPDSYLRGDPAAFGSAVGRSYFEQILPSGSVTLGWSSWAIQWLSRVPGLIPDQVQVAYSRDPAAREVYTRQAAEDWRGFLIHRSRELRAGGRLVVLTMALDAEGDFGYRALLEALYDALVEMTDTGSITPDERLRMAIPTVGRSRQDLEAPFAGGTFSDLVIEHVEVFQGEDRLYAAFEASGDAKAFGAQWAVFPRASVFPTMAAGLDGGPGTARAARFVDELEAGLAERLARGPGPTRIPLAKMVLRKLEPAEGA